MKVWLDDVLNPYQPFTVIDEDPWIWVQSYEQAVVLLNTGMVTEISLDYDLGKDKSGVDVARFIEEGAYIGSLPRLVIYIHSQHPTGRSELVVSKINADKFWYDREIEE